MSRSIYSAKLCEQEKQGGVLGRAEEGGRGLGVVVLGQKKAIKLFDELELGKVNNGQMTDTRRRQ
jgi:hypothetical protein